LLTINHIQAENGCKLPAPQDANLSLPCAQRSRGGGKSRLVMLFLFGEPRCLRAQGKRCMGGKRDAGAFSREKFVVTGGGNHGRVVRGEGRGREEHLESSTPFGETLA